MTFLQAINSALMRGLEHPKTLVLGQLVKYGLGGLTAGVFDRFPQQVITYPVCENLMHSSAMGLALAGYRPVVINERMDFLALAMDSLTNHIPVWPQRQAMKLPITVVAVVGKGKGQGAQHSKNFTPWFKMLDGWTVHEPHTPEQAYEMMLYDLTVSDKPVLYVAHREFFGKTVSVKLPNPKRVGLCGASSRHEATFYSNPDF